MANPCVTARAGAAERTEPAISREFVKEFTNRLHPLKSPWIYSTLDMTFGE
jgi:hypothetical protein